MRVCLISIYIWMIWVLDNEIILFVIMVEVILVYFIIFYILGFFYICFKLGKISVEIEF